MNNQELVNRRIDDLLDRFKAAATKWHLCHYLYLEDDKIKARAEFEAVVDEIDSLTSDGRAALIPFLENEDCGIQVIAASQLIDTKPEIALPALEYLKDNCDSDASFTAAMILMEYEFEQQDLRAAANPT